MSAIEILISTLRNQLLEYGELLYLLRAQQRAVRQGQWETVRNLHQSILTQLLAIRGQRGRMKSLQSEVASTTGRKVDNGSDLFKGMRCEGQKSLATALLDEVNRLILKARLSVRQNELLLTRHMTDSRLPVSHF